MSRFGPNQNRYGSGPNPITHTYSCPPTQQAGSRFKRTVDGVPHVCADGHSHASESEVVQCIDAHRVFVCSSNHMHTEQSDGQRCDELKREEECFKDKELQRQHEREMMDKQIKLTENLRKMDWNFKRNGIPKLEWREY